MGVYAAIMRFKHIVFMNKRYLISNVFIRESVKDRKIESKKMENSEFKSRKVVIELIGIFKLNTEKSYFLKIHSYIVHIIKKSKV